MYPPLGDENVLNTNFKEYILKSKLMKVQKHNCLRNDVEKDEK